MESMEIILRISRSTDGRFTGTASVAGQEAVAFSGTLELVATLERLLAAGRSRSTAEARPPVRPQMFPQNPAQSHP